MIVRCGFGIGNRVAALANGLSRASEIEFVWRKNAHCGLGWEEVFPAGIVGVEFNETAPPAAASQWDGHHAEDWAAAACRASANAAYGRIMAAMDAGPWGDFQLAVFGRFHRAPHQSPQAIGAAAARIAVEAGIGKVLVMSDLHRAEIAEQLAKAGVISVFPKCPELPQDLTRPGNEFRAFLADWQTLYRARKLIALDGPSSILHPIRAAGTPILYPCGSPTAAPPRTSD